MQRLWIGTLSEMPLYRKGLWLIIGQKPYCQTKLAKSLPAWQCLYYLIPIFNDSPSPKLTEFLKMGTFKISPSKSVFVGSKGTNSKAKTSIFLTYFLSHQKYIPFRVTFFSLGIRWKKKNHTAFPKHHHQGQICSVLSRCIQFLAMLKSWNICRPLMHRQGSLKRA